MKSLIEELAEETGIRPEILQVVVKRTIAHLHRGFHERAGQNGDYVGGRLPLDLGALRAESTEWEVQVSQVVEKDKDMARTVRRLERAYDEELLQQAEQE